MDCVEQSVMMLGMIRMPQLSVRCWDSGKTLALLCVFSSYIFIRCHMIVAGYYGFMSIFSFPDDNLSKYQ